MAYTDKEMRNFTQIAYADLTKGYEILCKEHPGQNSFSINDVKKACIKLGVPKGNLEQLDCLTKEQLNGWKIAGVHDTNAKNGFYACVIETSPGNVAVGFRGSESMESLDNVVYDWVGADIGLVNSTCTIQHAEVDRFLAKYKNQLNGYTSIAMSGHSLGGNLAEYATIVSGRYGLSNKISQCMSMDGPGFSDEFLIKYKNEIELMAGKIKHPRWSFVGTMLSDLPGVKYDFVNVTNKNIKKNDDKYTAITRHNTMYLDYDKNDNLIIGKQDGLSKVTSIISEGIDHLPTDVGNLLISAVCTVWIGAVWFKENFTDENGLTSAGWLVVSALIGGALVVGVGTIATTVAAAVISIISSVIVATALEIVRDALENAVDFVCYTIGKFYNWTKEKISDLFNTVISVLNKLGTLWNKTFNIGYRNSVSNPYIDINTTSMHTYATDLRSLSRRSKRLDARMSSLYWQLGINWNTIPNLGRLLRADIVLDFAYRLDKCAAYLDDTANEFEAVERDIMGYF